MFIIFIFTVALCIFFAIVVATAAAAVIYIMYYMFLCALGLELIQRTLAFFHVAHKFIVHLCKKIINFMAQRAIITSAFQFELLAFCQPEKATTNPIDLNFINTAKERVRVRETERVSEQERKRETHTDSDS